MTTRSRKTRTTTARAASDGPARVLGQNGARVIAIGDTDVEVFSTRRNADGEEMVTGALVPIPGERSWAIVQTARLDGSAWMIGLNGWLHDEFPSIHEAVEAVVDPATRKLLRERTAHWRRVYELEWQARELRAAEPASPEGAAAQ